MRKKPDSSHKTFNLNNDVIRLVEQASNINGMKQGEFIEFLVNSWDENINPIKRLKTLRRNKKHMINEISELEVKENEIVDNLQKLEEWRKQKQERRPIIIDNLSRMIKEGRNVDAEVVAKNQSIVLGIPAMTLILEAFEKVKGDKNA
ncbi:MAG: hypothetical protein FVQ78_10005 [Solirubrobacterales bacterium]|nr:hypothetical protein [Solirubrobacterales bacterium]